MEAFPVKKLWQPRYLARRGLAYSNPTHWDQTDFVIRIQAQQGQVVISLTSVQEIATMMFNVGRLTNQELEDIQGFRLTPFRANEEILAIIMKKPRDVYESFLSMLKKTKQYDVYQLLTRCDQPFAIGEHFHLIEQNNDLLTSILEIDSGLLPLLLQYQVISYQECERIRFHKNRRQRNQTLLDILCHKSPDEFRKFQDALKKTGQEMSVLHLTDVQYGKHMVPEHSRFIWKNYEILTSTLEVDIHLVQFLLELQVISYQEYESIQSRRNQIQMNEALLNVICRKSSDHLRRFKDAMEDISQGASMMYLKDKLYGDYSDYSNFLRKNYKFLTSTFDISSGLLPLLLERQVISAEEHERILSQEDRIQRNETLLSVIRRKSPGDFRKFKISWEETFPGSSDLTDLSYGSTDWRMRAKTLQKLHAVTRAKLHLLLTTVLQSTKLTPSVTFSKPIHLLSDLDLSTLFAEKPLTSVPALKRSTAVLTDRFKKLPDGLQTEISAKVLLMRQLTKGTSSDSLWDMCLRKIIQDFQLVRLLKLDILVENVKYKTITEKTQLQFAESQGKIRNLEVQNMKLNESLRATQIQLVNLKKENTYKEQRLAKELEYRVTEQQRKTFIREKLVGSGIVGFRGEQQKLETKPEATATFERIGRGIARTSRKFTAKVDVYGETFERLEGMETRNEAPKKLQQTLISPSLTKEQRSGILQKMKSFRFPKVSITNCVLEDGNVEFYFVLEGISSIEKSHLVNEIVTYLDVDASFAKRIKVTQLKSKPTGERTHSGPGNPIININSQSVTTLGAFLFIDGKGDHMLSCGHDKKVGDILSNLNKVNIGKTQAVADCTEDGQTYDAAVVKVYNINYTKSVAYGGRQLHLAATPVDPVRGTTVQRFPPQPMASRAIIRHTDYNSFVHDVYGCIAITTDNREAFHRPGESGLVVTSLPYEEFPDRVDPIGMLFFREFVEKTDDGRGYYRSLAIPITKNLEKLQEEEYCGGRQITFLSDT